MRRFRLHSSLPAPSSGSLSVLLRKGASVAGPFVLGASGANDCPPGSFAIATLAHCRAAVLGTPGVLADPTVMITNSIFEPKGCSKSASFGKLNRDPVGRANPDYAPICSSCAITAAPTTLATATPSYSNGRCPRRRVRFSGGLAQAWLVGRRRRRLDHDRWLYVELLSHVIHTWTRMRSGSERLLDRTADEHDRPKLHLGIYPAPHAAQLRAPRGHRQALVPLEDHPDVRPLTRRPSVSAACSRLQLHPVPEDVRHGAGEHLGAHCDDRSVRPPADASRASAAPTTIAGTWVATTSTGPSRAAFSRRRSSCSCARRLPALHRTVPSHHEGSVCACRDISANRFSGDIPAGASALTALLALYAFDSFPPVSHARPSFVVSQ
jgi:hypothetical protein